jgi:APA family basic amino acid/polyamine antiporter
VRVAARTLGPWSALALVVGNMIGSGIYLLPATLAPLGANALAGWGVTIAGAMCLAYVFARLAARVPGEGGPYAFANAAFGPVVGFFVAWSYWVLVWAGNGAVAVAVVSALAAIVPGLREGLAPALVALALVWLLIAVNVRGVALAGRVQVVTTVLKLVPLVGVVLLAAWLLLRDGTGALAPNPTVPLTAGAVAGAAALTFWGFLGVEAATVPAERIPDARRIVPLVTIAGTALTGIVYVLVAAAVGLLMPAAQIAQSPAPVADFLGRSLGDGAGAIVALFAAVSAFGALNGFILIEGEMPYAMARGGVFPRWFAHESRAGTPVRAHLVSGVLVTLVLALNYTGKSGELFAAIAAISLAAGMLAYLASALAGARLLTGEPVARVVALAAAGFVAWMIWGLGAKANLWGLGLLAAGLPVFLWVRRARTAGR